MASPKLLIGGIAAVGSVSTAGVFVAHQQGFFSSSSQTQSSGDTTSTEVPSALPAQQDAVVDGKSNRTKIEQWLKDNKGTDWKIKIQKGNETKGFKETKIEEGDLDGLFDYLNTEANKKLLSSIFSALETKDLIFDKSSGSWKHILTNTNVKEWLKTKSNNHTTLKLLVGEMDEEKTLEDITDKEDLQKLFECLKENESKFSVLTADKTLVFEKSGNEWKHIQKFIEDWVNEKSGSSNIFKTKDSVADKPLSHWSDEDLKELFNCLKSYEKLFTTIKKDNDDPKPILEFKKDERIWKLIASQKTIEIWVKANSGGKAILKLWEVDREKVLSSSLDSGELEKILKCLQKEEIDEKTFSNLVNGNNKTLVFEKTDEGWKHIKKAIKDWFSSTDGVNNKLQLQIKKDASTTLNWDDGRIEDTDLIGLLNHLKTAGKDYSSETTQPVTLQKKASSSTNEWEKTN